MAKARYQVKAPTPVNGMCWGMLFTEGVSREFDDKVLYDKLLRKGYKAVKKEKSDKEDKEEKE